MKLSSKLLPILASLALFSCIGIISCKKDKEEVCSTVQEAPKEFLDYWYFPIGSYWVYKLAGSNPAVYDTVRVGYIKSHYLNPGNTYGVRPCLMLYEVSWDHSNSDYFPLNGDPYKKAGYDGLHSEQDLATNAWYMQWSIVSDYGSPSYFFKYPIQKGDDIASNATVKDIVSLDLPVGTIDSCVYVDKREDVMGDTVTLSYLMGAYFAPQIGVVKTMYNKNRTWELVSYKKQ